MVRVEKGMALDTRTKKSGNNKANGQKWTMFVVKSEKGHDSLTVFAENADEADTFTTAKVGTINSVTKTAKRREDGTWETRISVNAFIEGVNARAVRDRDAYRDFAEQVQETRPTQDDFMDFTKASQGDDFGLPFN